ncbi:MAG: hypothetical protein JO131_01140 [Gammaproteobacteria bacterium]|nr:hypothetical protein [Gammaproteobacteria bacterium]
MNNKMTQELQWKKWIRAKSDTLSLPFQLILEDSSHPLICETILRALPGKRWVIAGSWDNKAVVAKLFYSRDAKRHFKNEMKGAMILHQANVPTPQLLYQGSAHKKRTQVILFEKIEDSISLEDVWQRKEEYIEIHSILSSFIIELATQHVLGILQRDLHLNNFLVTNKRIYTLDGSTIIQFDTPLDKKNSLENLGLFFAQLGVGTEKLQQDLFHIYAKARGWIVKKADLTILETATKSFIQERWRHYRKKIFRNCSAFKKISRLFQRGMYARQYQSPDFLKILQHPDTVFTDAETEILKKGRSATVAKIKIDNRYFVIKRYNIKNSIHWLRRCLRNTRAKTTWRLAQQLSLFGIPTAKPIAYIEKHFFGLNSTSYFFMEYIPGLSSKDYFATYQPTNPQYAFIAERVLALFHALTELHLTHGDLKNTNIIIHLEQPKLIDLDGMCEHTLARRLQTTYKKELKRFMNNWHEHPDIFALFNDLLKTTHYSECKK